MPSSPAGLLAVVIALVLTASACGSDPATTTAPEADTGTGTSTGSVNAGSDDTDVDGPEPTETDTETGTDPAVEDGTDPADEGDATAPVDAAAAAETNIDDLEPSDDVRTLEVLDVKTGEPTTIADAVTGDRPVLLWFWAPH